MQNAQHLIEEELPANDDELIRQRRCILMFLVIVGIVLALVLANELL
jgi:hypothetical protein